MLKLLILLIFSFFSFNAFTQITIHIVDAKTKLPVNGASILDAYYTKIGYSNIDGSVSIKNYTQIIIKGPCHLEKKFDNLYNNAKIEIEPSPGKYDCLNISVRRKIEDYKLERVTKYKRDGSLVYNGDTWDLKSELYCYDILTNFYLYKNKNNEIFNKVGCISGNCYDEESKYHESGYVWEGNFMHGRIIGKCQIYYDPNFTTDLYYSPDFFDSKINGLNFHYTPTNYYKLKKYKSIECGCLNGDCFNGVGTYVDFRYTINNGRFEYGRHISNTGNVIKSEEYILAEKNYMSKFENSIENTKSLTSSKEPNNLTKSKSDNVENSNSENQLQNNKSYTTNSNYNKSTIQNVQKSTKTPPKAVILSLLDEILARRSSKYIRNTVEILRVEFTAGVLLDYNIKFEYDGNSVFSNDIGYGGIMIEPNNILGINSMFLINQMHIRACPEILGEKGAYTSNEYNFGQQINPQEYLIKSKQYKGFTVSTGNFTSPYDGKATNKLEVYYDDNVKYTYNGSDGFSFEKLVTGVTTAVAIVALVREVGYTSSNSKNTNSSTTSSSGSSSSSKPGIRAGARIKNGVEIVSWSSRNGVLTVGNNDVRVRLRNKNSYDVIVRIELLNNSGEWEKNYKDIYIRAGGIVDVETLGRAWEESKDIGIYSVE